MRNIDSPLGEVVERGMSIYDSRLKPVLEPQHNGEYVVIDVDTGEYELDREHLAAARRAAAKHSNARLYATRVGWGFLGRLGGHRVRRR